ncbi:hypothetical protein ACWCQW_20120 [Streptomyces mirabilis]
MRIRATVAAATGALALSAFAVPAAHAAGTSSHASVVKAAQTAAQQHSGKSAFSATVDGDPYALNATFSAVKVNNGKSIVVGTTNTVKVPFSYTLTHGADVNITAGDFVASIDLYKGTSFFENDVEFVGTKAVCTVKTTTTATCTGTVSIDPLELYSSDAGTWKSAAFAVAYNGQNQTTPADPSKIGVAVKDPAAANFYLQRASKLTVNAAPEPVKKGRTITVTGALTRANWDNGKYSGYVGQPVKLQFKKKGATSYTTVKTIKTTTGGALKTTVTASVDGTFRYSFAGTTTTPAVNAAGDYVDVQ